jgi:hypothetical protein
VIIYPLLFICNGLDVTDTGFWLTSYNSFFSDPESVELLMSSWLTLFIGAMIEKLLNPLGIISFKISYLILFYLTVYFSYKILCCYGKINPLFFLPAVFTMNFTGTNFVHYYTLTMLTYSISLYLLVAGIKTKKSTYFFWSGIFFAINCFFKLPNFIGILFYLVFIIILLYYKSDKISLKSVIYGFFGSLLGLAFVFSLILYFNHFGYYYNSLLFILKSNHIPVEKFFYFYKSVALFAIYTLIIYFLSKKHKLLCNIFGIVMPVVLFICYFNLLTPHRVVSILVGSCLAVHLLFFLRSKSTSLPVILIILSSFLLIVSPLGSNTGVIKSCYSFAICLPLCLMIIFSNKNLYNRYFISFMILIFILSSIKGFTSNFHPYRDSTTTVFNYGFKLNCHKAKFIYSSKYRVQSIQEVLCFLKDYINPGDRIIAYEKISMLYYLTDTHPWLNHPWPLNLSSKEITTKFCETDNILPIVVRASYSTSNKFWPLNNQPLLNKYVNSRKTIEHYLNKYYYRKIWENSYFQVLVSDQIL